VQTVAKRARRDPRAESESPPPGEVANETRASNDDEPAARDEAEPRIDLDDRAVPTRKQAEPGEEPVSREAPKDETPESAPPASLTARDPRFARVEPLIGRNAWREIVDLLGPANEAGDLPPSLVLVLALAQRELAGEGSAAGANALAIQSMAALLGVPAESHTALLLAKRLLRQPPAGWRAKPAPSARVSLLIVAVGIAAGAAVGWFSNLGWLKRLLDGLKLF
jgi:hypothetical protein